MTGRRWLTLAAALSLMIGGIYALRGPLAERAMTAAYKRALERDPLATLPDGLHVGLCGSGSPLPDPTRAGPCTVVVAGRREFVVDSGTGSTKTLSLMHLPPAQVEAIFLTHFHSDHIADLGELMLQRWAGGSHRSPVPVYGPTGVESVVSGFNAAYALDKGYRVAHHGPEVVPPSGAGGEAHAFVMGPNDPDRVVYAAPDLQVIAFPVDHGPVRPAVGYLFIYKGRRAVISGDTAPSARLEAAARNADLLVHEGLSPEMVGRMRDIALAEGRTNAAHILHDIVSYHTAPEAAAAIAERAHVRYLLFTHVIPPLPAPPLETAFLGRSRSIFHGPVRVGRDGDFISLPAHSDAVRRTNLLHALF